MHAHEQRPEPAEGGKIRGRGGADADGCSEPAVHGA